MMTFSSRTFTGPKDLQSVIDLVLAVRPADRISDFPGIVDLRELFGLAIVKDNARLWFDSKGEIVGFAIVDHNSNLLFEIDRHAAHPDIEPEIVTWGVKCIRRAMPKQSSSLTLDASCRDDDDDRISFLERYGFAPQETKLLTMVRSLKKPIPAPQLPAGFSIRHVAGNDEVEAVVSLHRAAFRTENMTIEERLAMMGVPEYQAELDLLAIAPDNGFAGCCMCSISQIENKHSGRSEGYTDPIATHPDFRRRGLALALLLTGFQKLQKHGIDLAVLGTSSENTAMRRTAKAAGFSVRSTKLWYARTVLRDKSAG
jgi:mycothiol synthase